VRRRSRGLDAAALVDAHIHDDGTGLHAPHHGLGHDVRGARPAAQYRADNQVRIEQFRRDVAGFGLHEANLGRDVPFQLGRSFGMPADDVNMRAQAVRRLRCAARPRHRR
jgi:hypothetical protein